MNTKAILVAAKLLVSAALLMWLINSIGWHELLASIDQMDRSLVMVVAFMAVLQVPLSAWKWSFSLRQHNLHYSPMYLFRVCCGGFFLNNFLPTAVGGDAYRVIRTLPKSGAKSRAVSAAIFDRAIGVIALLFLGLLGTGVAATTLNIAVVDNYINQALILLTVLLIISAALIRSMVIKRTFAGINALQVIRDNLNLITRPGPNRVPLITLAIAYQALSIAMIAVLLAAAGEATPFVLCAIITAVGGLLIMLPISIAGIGVYEGALVGTATMLGVDTQAAIAASLAWRLLTTAVSMLCGLVFAVKLRPNPGSANGG